MSRPGVNPGPFDMERATGGRYTYTITCSGCGTTDVRANQNCSPITAREILSRRFAENGWQVHARKRKHLCPDCLGQRKIVPASTAAIPAEESPEPMNKPVSNNAVLPMSHLRVPMPPVPPAPVVRLAAVPTALVSAPVSAPVSANEPVVELATLQPPRKSTLDERKIINSKLMDVYGDASYSRGWSDERVAKDLGVPRAWVAEVRDSFFGPDLDEEAAAAETAALKAVKYAEKAHADLVVLADRVATDVQEMLKTSAELVAEAQRLASGRR